MKGFTLLQTCMLACALGACHGADPGSQAANANANTTVPPAVAIKTAAVQQRSLPRVVELSGSLAAPEDSSIAAEVDGRVQHIAVDLGDRVAPGQVIVRIDPEEYRLRLQQSQASLEQAESSLRRVQQLAETDMVAPQQLDDAKAQLLTTRASFHLAKKKAADTEVRAPFAGAVAKRQVSLGEYVRAGTTVFQIVATDPLKLTGEVSERFLPLVHKSDLVRLSVAAFPGEQFTGAVSRISPAVNAQSRSFTVEAQVQNAQATLKPGMFTKAEIAVGAQDDAVVVPETALTSFAGVTKLFSIADHKAREHAVEIERHLPGGLVAITGADLPLKAGDQVAVGGLSRLAEGTEVTVR